MTCTEFLALLDDLIDDTVTTEMRADLQAHLRGCERVVDRYRAAAKANAG